MSQETRITVSQEAPTYSPNLKSSASLNTYACNSSDKNCQIQKHLLEPSMKSWNPHRYSLQKAVVVGEVASLQDVLRGKNSPPFDLASFRVFAEGKMCVELIDFWCAVEKFRTIDSVAHEAQARYIYETYISEEGVKEINLSSAMRKRVHKRFLEGLKTADPTIFDETQNETELLLLADVYPKFVNYVHLRKNLVLSRNIALWCINMPSLKEFFTFPSPVNEAESRLHNFCTSFLVPAATALAVFCNFPYLYFYILYGFFARVVAGPRLDPQAFIVLFILRPLFEDVLPIIRSEYVPSVPKHFAQICGLLFSLFGTTFWFLNYHMVSFVFWGILFTAASFAAIFDFCVACESIYFGARHGWLPKTWCEDCTTHYVTGENHLKSAQSKKPTKTIERKASETSLNEFQLPTKKIKDDKSEHKPRKQGIQIKTFSDEESAIPLEKNLDKNVESNASLEEVKNKKPRSKYITRDIAKEALETYQVRVLANEKLTYNDIDILDFIHLTKGIEKSPLSIDPEVKTVNFSEGRGIDKFLVDSTVMMTFCKHEFSAYVWTPLLRNAFLGKTDLKLSCGTELLAQEDGVRNTRGKKTGGFEYCTKIILTVLFFTLPSTSKDNIKDIEVYSIQSNGFRLTISASKYLFDNTILTMDLQDIEIPRTMEGFSKLILAVKIILSWKARTKKTDTFYQDLNKCYRHLTKDSK
ncbi:4714_t:CDS:10 [Ambispora leptoticha]|uniref:4714_t:CDS:1 n=1 Tax=Ambispora leptoticha TaxID=144679 RepID=A0A9N9AWF6_9GLOM|nr:4714_t:CDS:10 [Ambispora leptoticha]